MNGIHFVSYSKAAKNIRYETILLVPLQIIKND
jgi:hypothetical protein